MPGIMKRLEGDTMAHQPERRRMPRPRALARLVFVWLAALIFSGPHLPCQAGSGQAEMQRAPAESNLLDVIEAEAKRGAYLSYTQSYVDSEKERVSYHGSIHGAIKSVEVNGCTLKLSVEIVDYFSGVVDHNRLGPQEERSFYTASFTLTNAIANALTIVEARPTQLANGTKFSCSANASCTFTWLVIQATDQAIKETRTTNRLVDFNGNTRRFLVPLSSAEVGKELMGRMRSLAESSCK